MPISKKIAKEILEYSRNLSKDRKAKNLEDFKMGSFVDDFVYHGTRSPVDFESFARTDQKHAVGSLSCKLGTHVAVDPEISNSFVSGPYAKVLNNYTAEPTRNWLDTNVYIKEPDGVFVGLEPEGRILKLHVNARPLDVKEDLNIKDVDLWDDDLVSDHIIHTLFSDQDALERYSDVLIPWYKNREMLSSFTDKEVFDNLSKVASDKGLVNVLKDLRLDDSRVLDKESAIKLLTDYKDSLGQRGYNAIKYLNTAPAETMYASDPTSYIIFEPEQLKSINNLGFYSNKDPRLLYGVAPAAGLLMAPSWLKASDKPIEEAPLPWEVDEMLLQILAGVGDWMSENSGFGNIREATAKRNAEMTAKENK